MAATPLILLLICVALVQPGAAEPIAVRNSEGVIHGFLTLSTLDGKLLAAGDLNQVARGGRVTSQVLFRFKDGSVRDETAVFSQRGVFRLLTYHLVQKGPAFQQNMDVAINTSSGQVTIRYTDDGKEKVESERMKLPPDLANGMIFTLLKNINPKDVSTTVSMLAATPKPRLVKLVITPQGEDPFSIAGSQRSATHFVVRVDIGGITGALAGLLGKQPPDVHGWVLGGTAPAFVKSEGSLYLGGPAWRIELTSPVWPENPPAR